MSEAPDNDDKVWQGPPTPISNRRILLIMAVVIILGTLGISIFGSGRSALGFFIGGALAFVNYYWLKNSLQRIFVQTAEGEYKPRYSATHYISRYLTLGAIIGIVFLTKIVPVAAVILGLASFSFAILIEGFIRIFSFLFRREEF